MNDPVRRIFYGWVVVAAAFVVMFVGFGAAYTFPAFFAPMQQEFSATRGEVSLVFSVAGFLYFILGAASGPLADRFGPRPVIAGGILCIALGMAAASQARSLLAVLLAYGIGVGVGVGFSYVPAIAAVQRWFLRKRGQASGIAVMGIGLGTMLMPPLAAWMIAALTWRGAYLALAVGVALLGGAAALAIRANPAQLGLRPDGEPQPPDAQDLEPASAPAPGFVLAEAVRHPVFWTLYLGNAFYCIGTFVPFVHLAAYAHDRGLTAAQGVWLVGLIGLGSTCGRFLLGGVADRLGRGRALACTMFLSGAMMGFWLWVDSFGGLAVFAVGFGMFYGGFVALIPAYTIDLFGARAASAIIGVLYTSVAFGTLVGPTLAGFAFDSSGSYVLPIALCSAASVVAASVIARLPARLEHASTRG